MRRYVARRFLLFVPVLIGVSVLIFAIMRVIPGDIALIILTGEGGSGGVDPESLATLRHQLGLDKPLLHQYFDWVEGAVTLDLGKSLWFEIPVWDELARRFLISMEIAILTVIVSFLIAIPIGTLSALRQDTWVDYVFRVVTIGGIAAPTFWTATLLILLLSLAFGWIPPLGWAPVVRDPLKNLQQVVWPVLILGYAYSAILGRMTRSTVLEVLRQDYVKTAYSKGLRTRVVIVRHALKNAILPVVTIGGHEFGHLLGGTIIMEKIFTIPGLGALFVDSIFNRDYPVVQAVVLFMALIFLTANLLVDLLYAVLDPRVRYG